MVPTMAPPALCTRDTARCPDARDYSVRLRDCCRAHIVEISRAVAEAFDAAGVRYWMDYGTLLGAVRNPMLGEAPGIIAHDKDADWGVLSADWAKAFNAVRAVSAAHQFDLRAIAHVGKMKIRLSRTNHTNLDVFFWYERPNHVLYRKRYAQVDQFKGREIQIDRVFPLVRLEWEGMQLPAPHDPEWFLAFRYGPNWRTPIAANHDGLRR